MTAMMISKMPIIEFRVSSRNRPQNPGFLSRADSRSAFASAAFDGARFFRFLLIPLEIGRGHICHATYFTSAANI